MFGFGPKHETESKRQTRKYRCHDNDDNAARSQFPSVKCIDTSIYEIAINWYILQLPAACCCFVALLLLPALTEL